MLKNLMKGLFGRKKKKEKKKHRRKSKVAAHYSKKKKKQFVDEELLKTLEREGFKIKPQIAQPIQSIQKKKSKKEKQKRIIIQLPKEKNPSLFNKLFSIFKREKHPLEKEENLEIIPELKERPKEEIKQTEKNLPTLYQKKQIQKKGFFSKISQRFKPEKDEELEPITILPPEKDFRLIKYAASSHKENNDNKNISQILKQEIMPQKQAQEQEELKLQKNESDNSSISILFERKKKQ